MKGLRNNIRMWKMVLLPPILTAILYFLIFGQVIGDRIGLIHGFAYMTYILPGLIMMAAMNSAYAQTSNSFFLEKFQHCIDEMLISPIYNIVILLGFIAVGIFRGLIVATLVLVVSMFFTKVVIIHWVVMLLSLLVATTVFAAAGLINAIMARTFDDIGVVPTFILTPLIYLGGVFYPLSSLPPFWRDISYLNPLAYIISSLRYSMLGLSGQYIAWAFAVMLLFIVFFLAAANYLMSYGNRLRA